jgi:hypothetical protein
MSLEEVTVATQLGGPSGSESSHPVAPPSEGMGARATRDTYRSERIPVRTSEANSSGCSQAAKCPPLSSLL